jgi:hypothetical protein
LRTGSSTTPKAARITADLRLSGTNTRGTAPSSSKASTCRRSEGGQAAQKGASQVMFGSTRHHFVLSVRPSRWTGLDQS